MALLSFDPQVGMTAPDTAAIRDLVEGDWINAFNSGDGSPALDTEAATPAGQCIDAETAYLAQANADLLFLCNQFNPLVAEGIWQDAIAKIYFINRKTSLPTTVTCQVTGLAGTVIPVGALIQDDDGIQYECTAETAIGNDGTASVPFQCTQTGPIECSAGTLNSIVTVIPGWDSVENAADGVTGRLVESQVDFENRRYDSVAKNAHGSAAALQGALADVEGVIDCRVLENVANTTVTKNGVSIDGHSVAICIYGGSDDDIAETIYLKKSGGCGTTGNTEISYTATDFSNAVYDYEIVRPTETNVKIVVTISDSETLPSDVETLIKNAVVGDFLGEDKNSGNTRVGLASTVYASRFSVAIIKTAGIKTLESITIALGTGAAGLSIDIPGDVEPVITADDVTVTVNS